MFEALKVTKVAKVTKLLVFNFGPPADVAKAHLNLLSQSLTRQKCVDESAVFSISWRVKVKINTIFRTKGGKAYLSTVTCREHAKYSCDEIVSPYLTI